jgi:hypothetical protein
MDGTVGGVDVLVEIAKEYDSCLSSLLQLYKFDEIMAKVVARIGIRAALSVEGNFLLVIGCDALWVSGFRAYLVG